MAVEGNYIVESDVDNWADAVSSTEEFATTDVNTTTDAITVVNDIDTASLIRFSTTAALPAPLIAGTAYYAINVDATHIKVAATAVLAAAGTQLDITDVGSGTHTLDVGAGDSEADRQAIIDSIENLIERATHDYFYAKSFTAVLDGNAKNRMFLGLLPDILSVTEILLSEVTLSTSLFSFDTDSVFQAALTTSQCKSISDVTLSGSDPVSLEVTAHGFVTGEAGRLIQMTGITPSLDGEYGITKVDADNLTLNGTDSSDYSGSFSSGTICFATLAELHYLTGKGTGVFPKGSMNVKVTGTYGWTVCPAMVKQAAVILCRAHNDETLYTRYDDLVSDKQGDASYGRGDKAYLTGIHEADRLLQPYIRKKPIMSAV